MKYVVALILLFAFSVNANPRDTIRVDTPIISGAELAFPNPQNTQPMKSDFSLLNSVLMSNELGDRWAVVTVQNNASGSRALQERHLMAVLANGVRVTPESFKVNLAPLEILSTTVFFGRYQFPVLTINTRTNR